MGTTFIFLEEQKLEREVIEERLSDGVWAVVMWFIKNYENKLNACPFLPTKIKLDSHDT